jgi:hypothetical protein
MSQTSPTTSTSSLLLHDRLHKVKSATDIFSRSNASKNDEHKTTVSDQYEEGSVKSARRFHNAVVAARIIQRDQRERSEMPFQPFRPHHNMHDYLAHTSDLRR